MRLSQAIAALLCAVAVGGCGGADPAPDDPHLESAVGARLARSADSVAAAADRGDTCAAARRAATLQQQAIEAVNSGDVPPALQEELLAGVNRVASSLECVPPPTPTPAPAPPPPPAVDDDRVEEDDEDDGGNGRGKGKGKKGKDKKGGDDD